MTDISDLIALVKPTVSPDSDVGRLIAELERLRDQEAVDMLDAKVHFLELEKAELLAMVRRYDSECRHYQCHRTDRKSRGTLMPRIYRDFDGLWRIAGHERHTFTTEQDALNAHDYGVDVVCYELYAESTRRRAAERAKQEQA